MVLYHGGWEDNPCQSVQYLMNHCTVHNHKPCAYEFTKPRKNSDRGEELQAEQREGRGGSM